MSYIINNNEFIGNGSYGLVVKLNNGYLLKFNYKDFIDAFSVDKNNRINLHQLGDITKIIENRKEINQMLYGGIDSNRVKMIKLAIEKQPKVKHSTLTQGLVYVNEFCVGYILKNHKNMIALYEYQQTYNFCSEEVVLILDKIRIAMKELIDNYIYLSDFTTHNILYNPNTKQIEIIDFEDSLICCKKRDAYAEKIMLDRFASIKKSFETIKEENLFLKD